MATLGYCNEPKTHNIAVELAKLVLKEMDVSIQSLIDATIHLTSDILVVVGSNVTTKLALHEKMC